MRRRDFITVLGGAAFMGPFAASAQQTARMRVSVLTGYAKGDPEAKALLAEFTQELSALGWIEGRNLRIDVRWAPGSTNLMHTFAKELVGLQFDVTLALGDRCAKARDTDDPNRLVPDSFPIPAETSQGSAQSKRQSRASGLTCSLKSRPTSSGPQ